jgi:hypothetical protein
MAANFQASFRGRHWESHEASQLRKSRPRFQIPASDAERNRRKPTLGLPAPNPFFRAGDEDQDQEDEQE